MVERGTKGYRIFKITSRLTTFKITAQMKVLKLCMLAALFATASLGAQEIANHALGLRLGESDGFGAEISYQKSLGRYTRAEVDLGFRDSRRYNAFKVAGLYQWVMPIDGPFNWYYGFGAGGGAVNFEPRPNRNNPNIAEEVDGGFFGFVAGDVGIEANFDLPILISLDFRPELGLIGYKNFDNAFDFDIALGVRYQF